MPSDDYYKTLDLSGSPAVDAATCLAKATNIISTSDANNIEKIRIFHETDPKISGAVLFSKERNHDGRAKDVVHIGVVEVHGTDRSHVKSDTVFAEGREYAEKALSAVQKCVDEHAPIIGKLKPPAP